MDLIVGQICSIFLAGALISFSYSSTRRVRLAMVAHTDTVQHPDATYNWAKLQRFEQYLTSQRIASLMAVLVVVWMCNVAKTVFTETSTAGLQHFTAYIAGILISVGAARDLFFLIKLPSFIIRLAGFSVLSDFVFVVSILVSFVTSTWGATILNDGWIFVLGCGVIAGVMFSLTIIRGRGVTPQPGFTLSSEDMSAWPDARSRSGFSIVIRLVGPGVIGATAIGVFLASRELEVGKQLSERLTQTWVQAQPGVARIIPIVGIALIALLGFGLAWRLVTERLSETTGEPSNYSDSTNRTKRKAFARRDHAGSAIHSVSAEILFDTPIKLALWAIVFAGLTYVVNLQEPLRFGTVILSTLVAVVLLYFAITDHLGLPHGLSMDGSEAPMSYLLFSWALIRVMCLLGTNSMTQNGNLSGSNLGLVALCLDTLLFGCLFLVFLGRKNS